MPNEFLEICILHAKEQVYRNLVLGNDLDFEWNSEGAAYLENAWNDCSYELQNALDEVVNKMTPHAKA